LALAASVHADDNVRAVQEKLRDGGFYSGEIDGAYSSDLSAGLSRYQIRNGLPITGQLDSETAKALDAKPAVGPSTPAAEQSSSETWRRLRKGERRTSTSRRRSDTAVTETRETSSPPTDEAAETGTETANKPREKTAKTASGAQSQDSSSTRTNDEAAGITTETRSRSAPAAKARTSTETTESVSAPPATARTLTETTEPASAPPATALDTGFSAPTFSTDRVRDYVAAFVLAGLDRNVGAETEFFADRVKYYDQGVLDREKVREDLQNYAARWPQRRFWFAGNITIEPQQLIIIIGVPERRKRIRVTFPLRYELRNGATYSSGTVNKTLVLEPVGDDLQIVAVSEVSESKK
jgi:hypothetical protein